MRNASIEAASPLSAALAASGFVGTWDYNVATGEVLLDRGAAAVLAGDRDFGGHPIPLPIALSCIHPEDRERIEPQIVGLSRTGGRFCAEYRVQLPSGEVRRVLDRGYHARQADGGMRGVGALFDTTEWPLGHASAQNGFEEEMNDPRATLDLLTKQVGQTASFRARVLLNMLRKELEAGL